MTLIERLMRMTLSFSGHALEASVKAQELIEASERFRKNGHDPMIWADHYFIAACYFASVNCHIAARALTHRIRQDFPEYDPEKRFSCEDVLAPDAAAIDGKTIDDITARTPLIEEMSEFIKKNPGFSIPAAIGYSWRLPSE